MNNSVTGTRQSEKELIRQALASISYAAATAKSSDETINVFKGEWMSDTVFASLSPGDILIAAPTRKSRVKHTWRPAVVMEKRENSIIALTGTSHSPEENPKMKKNGDYFCIPKDRYGLSQDTYVNITSACEIGRPCIRKRIGRLSEEDLKDLRNRMANSRRRKTITQSNLSFQRGDVISLRGERGLYYIKSVNAQRIYAYRATFTKEHSSPYNNVIAMSHNKYRIDKATGCMLEPKDFNRIVVMDWADYKDVLQGNNAVNTHLYEKEFPSGQVFLNRLTDKEYVYLYTCSGVHYGICLDDYLLDNQSNVVVLRTEQCEQADLISYDLMLEILDKISRHKTQRKTLPHLISRLKEEISLEQHRAACAA